MYFIYGHVSLIRICKLALICINSESRHVILTQNDVKMGQLKHLSDDNCAWPLRSSQTCIEGEFLHSMAHGTSYPVSINSIVGNPKVSLGIPYFCVDNHIITIILISLILLAFFNQAAFLDAFRLYLHYVHLFCRNPAHKKRLPFYPEYSSFG